MPQQENGYILRSEKCHCYLDVKKLTTEFKASQGSHHSEHREVRSVLSARKPVPARNPNTKEAIWTMLSTAAFCL